MFDAIGWCDVFKLTDFQLKILVYKKTDENVKTLSLKLNENFENLHLTAVLLVKS